MRSTKSPIAKMEVSRNSCSALTSPWSRDMSRPTSVRSMNESETCWRVSVHRAAKIEEHAARDPADHELLDEVGGVVESDHREEREDDEAQHLESGSVPHEGIVDRIAQDERDRDLGEGEDEHRGHPDPDPPAVGSHEGPEASHHPPVEGGAEHLLLERDLRADHRARGRERRARLRAGLHPPRSPCASTFASACPSGCARRSGSACPCAFSSASSPASSSGGSPSLIRVWSA